MERGNAPSLKFLSDNVLPDPECLIRIAQSIERAERVGISPYGRDELTQEADTLFRGLLGFEQGAARYFASGTAANAFAVAALTSRCSKVVCPDTAHVWQLEAGAVDRIAQVRLEPVSCTDGKLSVASLERALRSGSVNPGQQLPAAAIVISQPTELGTLYSVAELESISKFCRERKLSLILDGARAPYAAAALGVPLRAFAQCADVITLSLPKLGGLFGAVAVFRNQLAENLTTLQKGIGQSIDTTWTIAAQVNYLFADGSLNNRCLRCNALAEFIVEQLRVCSIRVNYGGTNVIFAELGHDTAGAIGERFKLYEWERRDQQTGLYRIVVGPRTTTLDAEQLIDAVSNVTGDSIRPSRRLAPSPHLLPAEPKSP